MVAKSQTEVGQKKNKEQDKFTHWLTSVVSYDNMRKIATSQHTAGFMDQSCAQGIRDFPGFSEVHLP
jgi:hypothetical protein